MTNTALLNGLLWMIIMFICGADHVLIAISWLLGTGSVLLFGVLMNR